MKKYTPLIILLINILLNTYFTTNTEQTGLIFEIKNSSQFYTLLDTYDYLLVYASKKTDKKNNLLQTNILEELVLDNHYTSLPLKIVIMDTDDKNLKKIVNKYVKTENNASLIFFHNGRMERKKSFEKIINLPDLNNFIEDAIDETTNQKIHKKQITKTTKNKSDQKIYRRRLPIRKKIIVERYSNDDCCYSYPRFGFGVGFSSPYYYNDLMWPGYMYNRAPSWYYRPSFGIGFEFRSGGWRHRDHVGPWYNY